MGFRSTMMTSDLWFRIPDWFVEKYAEGYHFSHRIRNNGTEGYASFPMNARFERKFYAEFERDEMFKDLQKVIVEIGAKQVVVILLHECDGITKVHVRPESIIGMEPTGWKIVDHVEHDYCYGCSDPERFK